MSDELHVERQLDRPVLFFEQPNFHMRREAGYGYHLEFRFFVSSNVEWLMMDARQFHDCLRSDSEHHFLPLCVRFRLYVERVFLCGNRSNGPYRECGRRPLRGGRFDSCRNPSGQQYRRLVLRSFGRYALVIWYEHVRPFRIGNDQLLRGIQKSHYGGEKRHAHRVDGFRRRSAGGRNGKLGGTEGLCRSDDDDEPFLTIGNDRSLAIFPEWLSLGRLVICGRYQRELGYRQFRIQQLFLSSGP